MLATGSVQQQHTEHLVCKHLSLAVRALAAKAHLASTTLTAVLFSLRLAHSCAGPVLTLCVLRIVGVAQANAEAVAEAIYEALTCDCECEQPTAVALAQAAAKAEGGDCGGVAQSLAGKASEALSTQQCC